MPVGDDQQAREDAYDDVEVRPDPAMVLLGRAIVVIADTVEYGLPADGTLPPAVDVTLAALDEWIRALAQTGAFLAEAGGGDPAEMRTAGQEMANRYGGVG